MQTNRNTQATRPGVNRPQNHPPAPARPEPAPGGDCQRDTVVVYVDGSYRTDPPVATGGFRLETNTGKLLLEDWSVLSGASTSTESEALAMLTAVRTAKAYTDSFVIVYSDCEPVVRKVEKAIPPRSQSMISPEPVYQHLAHELAKFEITSINHIGRERNKRADELAEFGACQVM